MLCRKLLPLSPIYAKLHFSFCTDADAPNARLQCRKMSPDPKVSGAIYALLLIPVEITTYARGSISSSGQTAIPACPALLLGEDILSCFPKALFCFLEPFLTAPISKIILGSLLLPVVCLGQPTRALHICQSLHQHHGHQLGEDWQGTLQDGTLQLSLFSAVLNPQVILIGKPSIGLLSQRSNSRKSSS
ncbi:hypothetical protein U0070_014890, partial [Myodes glareolus]